MVDSKPCWLPFANSKTNNMEHDYHDRKDGLCHCKVCNGAEGSLPTDCPKRRMTDKEETGVFQGRLNFRDGEWRKEDNNTHY